MTSLTDPGQPYSCEQWQDAGEDDVPLVLDENQSSPGFFDLFHDSWNAFPTFVIIDHTMTVRAKPWTLESNSNTSSCDGSNSTIDGWNGGNTNDFLQQLVDECGELCEPGSGTVDINVEYMDDWNMVGLPLGVEDSYYLTLFPDAIANTLFSFGEGYSLETNLVEGTGYWLRFDGYGSNSMIGDDFEEITVTLSEDWNMISGVSEPANVNSISDPYGLIIPNTIYSFGEGYELADVIEPGLGYWIRSYGEGNITISSNAGSGKSKFANRLTDANSISFNGQTLYFGVEIPQEEILSYSLPPKPPIGAFDVRFTGDWTVVSERGEIEVMNNSNQLQIEFKIHQDTWVLINQLTGEEYSLTSSGTIDLVGDITGFTLMKEDAALPSQYALAQNYPNPFNPVTSIRYSVPASGPLSLKVYDLLGEEVSTVVEGEHKAGFHTAQFDGSHLSSGIYFYRLSSKDHTITKKLILMK